MKDRFKVVTAGDPVLVQYDIEQAQEDKEAKYQVHLNDIQSGFVELQIGDRISVEVAREVKRLLKENYIQVHGFIVPDWQLATFMNNFDERIFRGRFAKQHRDDEELGLNDGFLDKDVDQ